MINLYNLSKEFISIFDELEENGGELTPELEEKLKITQDNLKTGVKSLANVIKSLEYECDCVKGEQKRLKDLYDRKQKVIERLTNILLWAINEYGDTKKTGVKYVAYETGEVSVRKTQAVDVNEELVERVGKELEKTITFTKEINQLDAYDNVDLNSIVEAIAKDDDGDLAIGGDDMNYIDASLEVKIPLKDLANGTGYNVIKEIAKYTDNYKLKTNASKSMIKDELKENGSCAPNIAKLVTNENINIK